MKLCASKCLQILSYLVIISAVTLLSIFIYWMVFPYNPITFSPQPIKVVNKEVKRGDYLVYEISFCKNTPIIPLITKTFIDGILYVTPQTVAINNPLGCKSNLVQNYVPKALPPGEYVIEISYVYKMNPIRNINISVKTEKFIVR